MTTPFLSIVMASYMGDYGGRYGDAATDRERKLVRAIDSVFAHSDFDGFELIVVADGCQRTMEVVRGIPRFQEDERLRLISVPKQRLWSEKVRNAGISRSRGEWMCYLDSDDVYEEGYPSDLAGQLAVLPEDVRWACVDDLVFRDGEWMRRKAILNKAGGAGTSNVAHRRDIYWPTIEYRWPEMGYDHDRQFLRTLKLHGHPARLEACGYRVMHIPKQYDL